METCPRCGGQGSVDATADGVRGCSRCGWRSDGGAHVEQTQIPTWKVLLPLAAPIACVWTAAALSPGRNVETPGGLLAAGIGFVLTAVWSAWNGVIWDRLSPGYHRAWRPPFRGTPFLLAVAFTVAGLWMVVLAAEKSGLAP